MTSATAQYKKANGVTNNQIQRKVDSQGNLTTVNSWCWWLAEVRKKKIAIIVSGN